MKLDRQYHFNILCSLIVNNPSFKHGNIIALFSSLSISHSKYIGSYVLPVSNYSNQFYDLLPHLVPRRTDPCICKEKLYRLRLILRPFNIVLMTVVIFCVLAELLQEKRALVWEREYGYKRLGVKKDVEMSFLLYTRQRFK